MLMIASGNKETALLEWLKDIRKHIHALIRSLCGIDQVIAGVETFLLVLLLFFLMIAEVATALFREIGQANIAWVEQLLKYVVIWVGLLGASLATRSGEHISIEVVSRFTGPKLKRLVAAVVNLSAAFITFLLATSAYQYLKDDLSKYMINGGRVSYFSFSGIQLYHCPEATNQKRFARKISVMKTKGHLARLTSLINKEKFPQSRDTLRKIDQELEKINALSNWQLDWLNNQWKQHWQQEYKQAWNKVKRSVSEKSILASLTKKDQADWQAGWLSHFWHTIGKKEFDVAWHRKGLQEWKEEEEDSDLNEEEFRDEWKYEWIQTRWQEKWQAQLQQDWKQGGAKQFFRDSWQKKWLEKKWQKKWSKQWTEIQAKHDRLYFKPGVCPYCKTKLQGAPWKIPRWYLLIIIPISLFLICGRFCLRFLQAAFIPEFLEGIDHET